MTPMTTSYTHTQGSSTHLGIVHFPALELYVTEPGQCKTLSGFLLNSTFLTDAHTVAHTHCLLLLLSRARHITLLQGAHNRVLRWLFEFSQVFLPIMNKAVLEILVSFHNY